MTLLTDTETAQYRDAAKELLKRRDKLTPYEIKFLRTIATWSGRISKFQAKFLENVDERLNNGKES